MKGRCRGPRSKPNHSSLHSYLGKEGFVRSGRDGEMRRTGGPLRERERERGVGGVMEDELGIQAYRSREKKRKIYHKNHSEWEKNLPMLTQVLILRRLHHCADSGRAF